MASIRPQGTSRNPPPRAKLLRPGELTGQDGLSSLLAHDLKSPLAAISMNLEYALSELRGAEHQAVRAALEDCREANARAVRIVSDMADAMRLVSGDRRASLRDVAASKVIESAVARAAADASARGVRIAWASSDDLVRADPNLLASALDRLVLRAVRHAIGTCVVDHRAGTIVIRAEVSQSGDAAGHALSVVFAEAAIRAQGGRFGVETTSGALVYQVSLPLVSRPDDAEVIR
jgi:signal transduction histidine kinase